MSFTVKSAIVQGDNLIVTMLDGEQELRTTFTGRVTVSLSLGTNATASLHFFCDSTTPQLHPRVNVLEDPPIPV